MQEHCRRSHVTRGGLAHALSLQVAWANGKGLIEPPQPAAADADACMQRAWQAGAQRRGMRHVAGSAGCYLQLYAEQLLDDLGIQGTPAGVSSRAVCTSAHAQAHAHTHTRAHARARARVRTEARPPPACPVPG